LNVYFLFALAFGTLTGVTEMRVRRDVVSVVRSEKRVSASRVACGGRALSSPAKGRRTTPDVTFRARAPLTCSISPRAPAVNC